MPRLIGQAFGFSCLFLVVDVGISNGAELSDERVKTKLTELVQEYLDFEREFARSLPKETQGLAESDRELSDEEWLQQWKNEASGGPDEKFLPRFLELAERHSHSPHTLDALTYVINRNKNCA